MPKKKLTKAQVKRIMKQLNDNMAKLMIDKSFHKDSFVGMSLNKVLDLQNRIRNTVIK
jgi:hypothetical protein